MRIRKKLYRYGTLVKKKDPDLYDLGVKLRIQIQIKIFGIRTTKRAPCRERGGGGAISGRVILGSNMKIWIRRRKKEVRQRKI
jgi:hypothetical protein